MGKEEKREFRLATYSAPLFIDFLVRTQQITTDEATQHVIRDLDEVGKLDTGFRNITKEIGQLYLATKRVTQADTFLSIQPRSEITIYPASADMFIYRTHLEFRLRESITSLKKRATAKIYRQVKNFDSFFNKLVSTNWSHDIIQQTLPNLAPFFNSRASLQPYELLTNIAQHRKKTKTSKDEDFSEPIFQGMAEMFIQLLDKDQPHTGWLVLLSHMLAMDKTTLQNVLSYNLKNLTSAEKTSDLFTTIHEFIFELYLALIDVDHPNHESSKALITKFIAISGQDRSQSISFLAKGVHYRDVRDQELSQNAWLNELLFLANEEGEWYAQLYAQVLNVLADIKTPLLYQAADIPPASEVTIGNPVPETQLSLDLRQAFQQVRDLGIASVSETLLPQEIIPTFPGYDFVKVRVTEYDQIYSGALGFVADPENLMIKFKGQVVTERPQKILRYVFNGNDLDARIEWDLLNANELPPNLDISLQKLLLQGLNKIITQAQNKTAQVVTDEIAPLPAPEIYTSPKSKKRFGWQAKKETKRSNPNNAAKKDDEEESGSQSLVNEKKEALLKPRFNFDDQMVAAIEHNFDKILADMIIKKLENQKRGTSKVKLISSQAYLHNVGAIPPDTSRAVYQMRVSKSIRIFAMKNPGENTAEVYQVVNKEKD